MNVLLALLLTLVALAGAVCVVIREPVRQAIGLGMLSLLLSLLFFALGAPDVALSEIVVGTVFVPAMLLLAVAKIRQQRRAQAREAEVVADEDEQ
jgi:energy-converting hydrogenase B subunit D